MAENNLTDNTLNDLMASTRTPCETRGPGIRRRGATITVREGSRIDLLFLYCFSPGRLVLRLDLVSPTASLQTPLFDQIVPPPPEISRSFPPLPVGLFIFQWTFMPPPNTPWQILVELTVNGNPEFRHFNSNQSAEPIGTGSVFLEVVP